MTFACHNPSSNHNLIEFKQLLRMQLWKYLFAVPSALNTFFCRDPVRWVHLNAAVQWKLVRKFTVQSSVSRVFPLRPVTASLAASSPVTLTLGLTPTMEELQLGSSDVTTQNGSLKQMLPREKFFASSKTELLDNILIFKWGKNGDERRKQVNTADKPATG